MKRGQSLKCVRLEDSAIWSRKVTIPSNVKLLQLSISRYSSLIKVLGICCRNESVTALNKEDKNIIRYFKKKGGGQIKIFYSHDRRPSFNKNGCNERNCEKANSETFLAPPKSMYCSPSNDSAIANTASSEILQHPERFKCFNFWQLRAKKIMLWSEIWIYF